MAKKTTIDVVEEQTKPVKLPEINDSGMAIATWFNPLNQHWYLVKVSFDPILKVSTTVELEDLGPSKDESVSRFKIAAGRMNFV